ncbi:DNA polymerase III subunit epsilon [Mucilaginibacter sp. RS28]|uniref:DNA polymerase III subunit epsilon n=1 Tax=Mucilaginibacter straminoryzae TaxID=2932774 RepID=A0A9X2BD17_9SPHI|nr:3'-5' exonuclease [Mucilaginibacter straminoryzae]MCJ8209838.1 DNA polymerase III subunit epsilon [Mucilaginibacter straminoryzae]
MKLNLKRPLAFFDIEATGTNIGSDRIVEIAVIKLNPDGSEETRSWRVNPEIPIPFEVSVIHGIYDEHIKDEKTFKELAAEIAEFIGDSDLAGFNSNKFDIPMLMEEFLRADVSFDLENRHLVDVQNIFHQMEQRTLKAAYRFYCEKDIINAHSAEADTRATMEVFLAQLQRYEDKEVEDKEGKLHKPIVNDIEALHHFTNLNKTVDFAGRMVYNNEGHELFNFGKHKGKKVVDVFEVEPSYYSWIMQGDFPLYTKRKVEQIYKRWAQERAPRPKPAPQAKPADQQQRPSAPQQQQSREQGGYQKKPFEQRQNRPYQQNNQQQYRKKDEPAKPVDDDMLKALSDKFKKG